MKIEQIKNLPTNESGFVKFQNRDWSFRGDKGTWIRVDNDEEITVAKGKGTISGKYTEELVATLNELGIDFDAIRYGTRETFKAE